MMHYMGNVGGIKSKNKPSHESASHILCEMPNQIKRSNTSQGKGDEQTHVL
jgi:hypothetical protein